MLPLTERPARARLRQTAMEDYASKPVSPEDLDEVLRRWVAGPAAAAAPTPAKGDGPVDESVLDQLVAIEEGGSLHIEVIDTFLRVAPVRLAALTKAAGKGLGRPRAHDPQLPGELRQPGCVPHGRDLRRPRDLGAAGQGRGRPGAR